MKKVIISLVCLVSLITLTAPVQAKTALDITELENESGLKVYDVFTDNSDIIWVSYNNSGYVEPNDYFPTKSAIFKSDGQSTEKIFEGTSNLRLTSVTDGKIAWVDDKVYLYENGQIREITPKGNYSSPKIIGDKLLYEKDNELYLQSGSEAIKLSAVGYKTDIGSERKFVSNGEVFAWIEKLDNGLTFQENVMYFDGQNVHKITSGTTFKEFDLLTIDGLGKVFYSEFRNLYVYSDRVNTVLSSRFINMPDKVNLAVDGKNILWSEYANNEEDAYTLIKYDGTEKIIFANNSKENIAPKINSENIVWKTFDRNINTLSLVLENDEGRKKISDNVSSSDLYDQHVELDGSTMVWRYSKKLYLYKDGITSKPKVLDEGLYIKSYKIEGNKIYWVNDQRVRFVDITNLSDDVQFIQPEPTPEPEPVIEEIIESEPEPVITIQEPLDSDGDGLTDEKEWEIGTNRYCSDSDGDGYSDYEEYKAGYSPLVHASVKTFAYGQPRLKSITKEQEMAGWLKHDLEEILGKGGIKVSAKNWHTLVNSYIYGGYTSEEIAHTLKYGPGKVHPTIPAYIWRN